LKILSIIGTIIASIVLAYFAFDVAVLTVSIVASVVLILVGALYILVLSNPGNEISIKLYGALLRLRSKFL